MRELLVLALVVALAMATMLTAPPPRCFGQEEQEQPAKVIATPPEGTLYHGVFPGPAGAGEEDEVSKDSLASYTNAVGKPVAWVFFSHNWFKDRKFPAETASWIREAGSVPYIRLMLRSSEEQNIEETTFTLQRLVKGDFDSDLREWAKEARAFGTPLLAEYGVEMNGRWFPWNAVWNGGGTTEGYGDASVPNGPEIFRDTYRRIIKIARQEGAHNVTWVFHVNNEDIPDEPWNKLDLYYPGDEWIDWLAVSAYGAQKPADEEWATFREMMDKAYPRLAALSPDKPVIVAEFGCTSGHKTCKQAEWAEKALSDLTERRWPRVIGFCWWNEMWENDENPKHNTNMRVQDSRELAGAFRRLVGSSERVIGKPVVTHREASDGEAKWSSINDFVYQLQRADLDAIGRTKFDLVVVDYSRDGSEGARFSKKEIAALKTSPGGNKLVLAYMSIGEAEDYRWYWREEWDADRDGKPDEKAPAW
ncbi:MAG: glycosyl hydrolase, partial [Planctomycetota bacterium]|nr:glycosyl hydrolase [Planctomycetota bacterium]